jgi:multiple antibiotic resistance protein
VLCSIVGQLLVLTAPGCFIPVILALTPGRSAAERVRVVCVAAFVAASVLVAFALWGSYVLEFFGFSLPAFKIAGGTYLVMVGVGLLFNASGEEKPAADAGGVRPKAKKSSPLAVAIAPLGIPLLSGPGMISVVVTRCVESTTLGGKFFLAGAIAVTFALFIAIISAAMLGARYIGKFALDVAAKFPGVYVTSVGFLICLGGITATIRI